jgi:hypothetical protein
MVVRRTTRALQRAAASVVGVSATLGIGVGLAAPAATQVPLTARVLKSGELTGFKVNGSPRLAFASGTFARLVGQPSLGPKLAKAGFVRGAFEILAGKGVAAYSVTLEFKTAAGARSRLVKQFQEDLAGGVKSRRLPVPGVPGAKGAVLTSQGLAQAEVLFADGRFLYIVTTLSQGGTAKLRQDALTSGARTLYLRVRGTGGPAAGAR